MTPNNNPNMTELKNIYHKAVTTTELQTQVSYLRQHLPQVISMDISAGKVDEHHLGLCAPLEPNINDKLTAFGGSLASLATLTGWVMTAILAQRYPQTCDIVVTHTETDFKLPVVSPLIVTKIEIPESSLRQEFGQNLASKGRAKITIKVEIETEKGIALQLVGRYLARLK